VWVPPLHKQGHTRDDAGKRLHGDHDSIGRDPALERV
jgi:hypothetical protein